MTHHAATLIIGAGPAGMAMAGRFSMAGLPFLILEQAEVAGNTWRNHYDRLHLHTVKKHSHLPHLPFPDDYPKYVPRHLVVEYLDQYLHEMKIEPLCGREVVSVRKEAGRWQSETKTGECFTSDQVIVATGFNRVPYSPSWPGMEVFEGTLKHSKLYKNGSDLKGKNVLVIGMGNTGAELAIDLHEHGANPFISVRGPVNIVPRDFKGNSTQETAMLLAKLPNWLGDFIGTQMSKVMVGNLRPYGIERPHIPPSRQLREWGKTPVIDVGTIDLIKSGHITVLPEVREFLPDKIRFADERLLPFDAVILATGYRAQVQDFLAETEGIMNAFNIPGAIAFPERYPGLYFLGYDGYATGGLFRAIRLDSEVILNHIRKP